MRTANAIALALMLAIPQTSFTEGLNHDDSGKAKTADITWIDARGVDQPTALAPEDFCWSTWTGPPAGVANGWFWGGEYYSEYQDPYEEGCTDAYPFNVTEVQFVVRNPPAGAGDLTVPMQAVIYTVDLTDPECPKPGVVIGRGPMTPVFIADDDWETAQLSVDVCVNGPYFAGVYCPERIGSGTLDVGIADPAANPWGQRPCAQYNNYDGIWKDLVDDGGWVGNLLLSSGGYNSTQNSCVECPTIIPEGYDLWQSSRDGDISSQSYSGFTTMPLPADFFGPGSDPFDGAITNLEGQPLETDPPDVLGQTDMIIRRLDAVTIPAPGGPPQTVDIEIVALSLVSSQPITVTYFGGMVQELWDVRISMSNFVASFGSLDVESWCCDGGVWNWQPLPFYVWPRLTFTRVSDAFSLGLDALENGYPGFTMYTYEGRWSAAIDPPTIPDMVVSQGRVFIDHDNYLSTPPIEIGQSSRFVLTGGLGEPWFPEPCSDDYCPVDDVDGGPHISRVELGSIDNATDGSSNYSDYYGTHAATMTPGGSYPFTVTGTDVSGMDNWKMWVDWNNDFDFYDAGEEVGNLFFSGGPLTGVITPPFGSEGGSYRMRVRMLTLEVPEPCGSSAYPGEAEDYRIDVVQGLCVPTGVCLAAYIGIVYDMEATPITTSTCDGYADYFDATYISVPNTLSVLNPSGVPAFVGAWVDWNQDNDFDDAYETVPVTGQGTPGPYVVPLVKPPGTPSGEYRLRIAIDMLVPAAPCGTIFGEVEDYKVVVSGCCEGRVGDANGQGVYPDEVTLGDIMLMVDALFISSDCTKLPCPDEADVNHSGGANPPQELCLDYVTLGDIMTLVDFLFITGPEIATLPDCL